MRLGLLGPTQGNEEALERAARFLVEERQVDRAVYLGVDTSLERIVQSWAEQLVGGDPGEDALLERATKACVKATSEQIDTFLQLERDRTALKLFESLPGESTRAIELLSGKVAVIIYDKAFLDEEDILPASLLVFGKSEEVVIKPVGKRWFLSPGPLGVAGLMVLDEEPDGVRVTVFDPDLKELHTQVLPVTTRAKLKVSGGD
jgi:hypothetical protein